MAVSNPTRLAIWGAETNKAAFSLAAGIIGSGASAELLDFWVNALLHRGARAVVRATSIRSARKDQVRLAAILLLVIGTSSCWVQSVYPFYEDSDIVVDSNLAGTWIGQSELKNRELRVKLDVAARKYTLEISSHGEKALPSPCETAAFEGQLEQVGQQRFFDIWPDPESCWTAPLNILLKVDLDKQKLELTPFDADWLANAMETKSVKLSGRSQEFGSFPRSVSVTLISPSADLREFLRQHGDDKTAFSESSRMEFQRLGNVP